MEPTATASIPWWFVMIAGIAAILVGVLLLLSLSGGGSNLAILGIMNAIFAIILLLNPVIGVFLLPIILGIIAVIGGGLAVVRAFASRPRQTPLQPPGAQPV